MSAIPLPLGIYPRQQERLVQRFVYAEGEIQHSNMGAIVAMLEGSRGARQRDDLADPAEWQQAYDRDTKRPPMQAARLIREVDSALKRIGPEHAGRLRLVYGVPAQVGMGEFGGARNLLPHCAIAQNIWRAAETRATLEEWAARLCAKKQKTEFDRARIREIVRALERDLIWSLKLFARASGR